MNNFNSFNDYFKNSLIQKSNNINAELNFKNKYLILTEEEWIKKNSQDFISKKEYEYEQTLLNINNLIEEENKIQRIDLNINSEVTINNSEGNKFIFNNNQEYNSEIVYQLSNGVYNLTNISQQHPIAILNNGIENQISYTGDDNKKFNKDVIGTTLDGNYNFYYGNINLVVNGNFNKVSIYCYNHGYMGGENLFVFKDSNNHMSELNILLNKKKDIENLQLKSQYIETISDSIWLSISKKINSKFFIKDKRGNLTKYKDYNYEEYKKSKLFNNLQIITKDSYFNNFSEYLKYKNNT